jgi:hypothetical protein
VTAKSCGDGTALIMRDCVMSWDGNTPSLQGAQAESLPKGKNPRTDVDQASTVVAAQEEGDQGRSSDSLPPSTAVSTVSSSTHGPHPISESRFTSHSLSGDVGPTSEQQQHASSQLHTTSSTKFCGLSLSVPTGSFLSVVGSVGAGVSLLA